MTPADLIRECVRVAMQELFDAEASAAIDAAGMNAPSRG